MRQLLVLQRQSPWMRESFPPMAATTTLNTMYTPRLRTPNAGQNVVRSPSRSSLPLAARIGQRGSTATPATSAHASESLPGSHDASLFPYLSNQKRFHNARRVLFLWGKNASLHWLQGLYVGGNTVGWRGRSGNDMVMDAEISHLSEGDITAVKSAAMQHIKSGCRP
jgi:hypothetical protein